MAIDSPMKRFSMLNMASGAVYPRLFEPDGAVDGDDRAFLLRIYGGNALQVGGDTTPDAFTFTDVTGQELGAVITSNTITISGINATTPVNFLETGHLSGEFSINGAAFTDLIITTIENGDTLQLRLTSSALQNEKHSIEVTIGGVVDTWDVTTLEEWSDQVNDSTTWTDESNESTTWTDQADESTTWTDQ